MKITLVFLIATLIPFAGWGQSKISGTVTDQSGEVIIGAPVALMEVLNSTHQKKGIICLSPASLGLRMYSMI